MREDYTHLFGLSIMHRLFWILEMAKYLFGESFVNKVPRWRCGSWLGMYTMHHGQNQRIIFRTKVQDKLVIELLVNRLDGVH